MIDGEIFKVLRPLRSVMDNRKSRKWEVQYLSDKNTVRY